MNSLNVLSPNDDTFNAVDSDFGHPCSCYNSMVGFPSITCQQNNRCILAIRPSQKHKGISFARRLADDSEATGTSGDHI